MEKEIINRKSATPKKTEKILFFIIFAFNLIKQFYHIAKKLSTKTKSAKADKNV